MYHMLGCIILKALPLPYISCLKVISRKKVTHSIRLLLMTLYRYHSLAVYRKNVHDMKSHNIQEITFSCHTKSFSCLYDVRYFGKNHVVVALLLYIKKQEQKLSRHGHI